MIKKSYRFIHEWIPKYLTIYGWICVVKSYVTNKSWYLTFVIPPQEKMVLKINAIVELYSKHFLLLWRHHHKSIFVMLECSNIKALRQLNLLGGLNVQQYDFQLIVMHSKWIVTFTWGGILLEKSRKYVSKNIGCNILVIG